jgi:hypothetical protein
MTTFIAVYHSGVVITNEIGSYKFVGMKNETFLLNEFLTLENVVGLLRGRLGWMYEGCEVLFEYRIDIGLSNGPRMKMMSPVCNEEWTTYVGVVMKLEIHGIELFTKMVTRNDVGDESSQSLTLPEAIDEQHIECGVVLTQLSQATQDDLDAYEPPFIASNETMLNMKPVSKSVSVGNVVADAGFISDVDPQSTATCFTLDVDPPSVELEFMPEYETAFGDERVEDSIDDRLVPELSNRDKTLL